MSYPMLRYNGKRIKTDGYSLDLPRLGLNKFSDLIGYRNIKFIKHLNLYSNNLEEITDLDHMVNIETLNIQNNNLTEIHGLENLKKLKVLNLGNNKISKIKGLDNLSNLEEICLQNNKIEEIEGIAHLPKLRILNLSFNEVSEISPNLEINKNLRTLDIRGNPISLYIPKEDRSNAKAIFSLFSNKERQPLPSREIEKNHPIKEDDSEIIENINKIMSISSKIRISMMRNMLNMDEYTFDSKLLDWALKFNFKIDGDYLIIEDADIKGFIDDLDNQFQLWDKKQKK